MMSAILIDDEVFSVIKITQLPITQQSSHTVYRVISLFRQLTVGVKASVFFTIGNFHDKFLTNIIFIQSSSSFDLCLICVWIYDVHSRTHIAVAKISRPSYSHPAIREAKRRCDAGRGSGYPAFRIASTTSGSER